jgi:hypothetical protein
VVDSFGEEEIEMAIARLRTNRSTGTSWIAAEYLKGSKDGTVISAVTKLFNKFRTEGIPESWSQMHIRSIHKKGTVTDMNNFRPIALISIMCKLYSMVVLGRLEKISV